MKAFGILLLLSGLACAWPFGDQGPDPLEEAESQARLHYPEDLYFHAVGVSKTGSQEAQAEAREEVAGQVSSSIRSTLTSLVQEEERGGRRDGSARTVLEETRETSFDQAQLIRCEPAHKTRDGWLAVAWLSRTDALHAMEVAYEDTARRFRASAREALGAEDVATFTPAWREAVRLGAWLRREGVPFVSIAGLPITPRTMGPKHPHAPQFPADMALLDRLDSARTGLLSRQRVALGMEDVPAYRTRAGELVRAAGLRLAVGGGDWRLSLRWEKEESESPYGEIDRCRLTPTVVLGSGTGLEFVSSLVTSSAGEAFKVRDPKGACAQARDRIDPVPLDSALAALLRTAFPLP
jgi:hypothetical protein